MTSPPPFNVLFLCTGNSARSILAEGILSQEGAGRFRAFSAGSHPRCEVRPEALRLLEKLGHPAAGLRSKSWDEFAAPGAPELHFVITVCDNAAGEVCPLWPGQPMTAHWGVPDPAAVEGAARPRSHWPSARRTGCSTAASPPLPPFRSRRWTGWRSGAAWTRSAAPPTRPSAPREPP